MVFGRLLILVTAGPILCVYTSMTTTYSVAHTHVGSVFALAQKYGFRVYKRHLNSYVHLWCLELDSSMQANLIRLQYSEYLTQL